MAAALLLVRALNERQATLNSELTSYFEVYGIQAGVFYANESAMAKANTGPKTSGPRAISLACLLHSRLRPYCRTAANRRDVPQAVMPLPPKRVIDVA